MSNYLRISIIKLHPSNKIYKRFIKEKYTCKFLFDFNMLLMATNSSFNVVIVVAVKVAY